MNYSTIVSTANVVFQPAVLGVTPSGIRSAPNAPSSKYNMLEAFVNIPNSTYNSGMRVCELALSNRFSNTASNYDYDLSLTSTGQPPTGPPTPGINYRRVLATAYNGGNPASTFTVAYQSDSPAQIIYISSNGDDTYATGTFANPFKSFDLAQTYLNTNNVPDSSPIIFVFAPGQQTFTFTVTRNNTYITTYYPNPSGFDINQPLLSQVITWQVIPFTTGATRIAGGMFGVNCWNLNVITQQNLPTLFDFENCTVINQNAGTAFIITNTTSPVTTINMTNCYLASQTGNGIISTANNFSNLSLNLINCYGNTSGASRLITVGCNLIIRNSVFTNTSASTSNQPIVSMNNTGATPVTNSCEITNSQLIYTSNASDSVSGVKCCIQFQNSVAMTYKAVNNLFVCEGATTTNGTAGQFLCVQKINGTGLVTFNYGNVQAGATANHFPNNGAVWAKTAYVLAA
jgi:hypothetical protein